MIREPTVAEVAQAIKADDEKFRKICGGPTRLEIVLAKSVADLSQDDWDVVRISLADHRFVATRQSMMMRDVVAHLGGKEPRG